MSDPNQLHACDLKWSDIGRPLRVRAVYTAGGTDNRVMEVVRSALDDGLRYDGLSAYIEGPIRSIAFGADGKVDVAIGAESRPTSLHLDADCEVWL